MSQEPVRTRNHKTFISYTHIDNEPFGEEGLGWVTHFHEQLQTRLQQILGSHLDVWRDSKLAGNDVFDETLVDRLRSVDALVAVCSPRYLRSEWCRRELHEFIQAAETNGGLAVGSRSRIFKVLKTPVDLDDLPSELRPLLGYEFYDAPGLDGRVREFLLDPEDRWRFYARLDDLAQDLGHLIEATEQDGAGTPETPPAMAVYLAVTSFDIQDHRDSVKRELQRRGYRVLPVSGLPLTAAEITEAVTSDLADCSLSVHPFGAHYGVRPEGDERSIPHLQFDLAREMASLNGLAAMAWVPEGVVPTEAPETELLTELASGGALNDDVEFLSLPTESFKDYLLNRIERPKDAAPEAPHEHVLRRVYVMYDVGDRDHVKPLTDALAAAGHDVLQPLQEGTEAEARDVHRASLVHADSVLIFYGAGTEYWLRMKLFDLLKAAGWGRPGDYTATAIYVGPPATDHKRELTSRSAMIIRGNGDLRQALAPFLAKLQNQGAQP